MRTYIGQMPAQRLELHCHGSGCTSTSLVRAHLTPQSFARRVQGESRTNLLVSPSRYTTGLPRGLYDPAILCADCDNFLNTQYDDPGFALLNVVDEDLSARDAGLGANAYFQNPGLNCGFLIRFVLSILWRYSISRLPDTSEVNLGPYQNRARDVLWGAMTLTDFPEFKVVCQRYTKGLVETRKMLSSPVPMKDAEFNAYGFSLLGFHFLSKVDRRSFPPMFKGFIVNESDVFRGYYVDFHETPQGRGARDLLVAARRRLHQKRR